MIDSGITAEDRNRAAALMAQLGVITEDPNPAAFQNLLASAFRDCRVTVAVQTKQVLQATAEVIHPDRRQL
jgi:hypothetical protein